MRNILILLTLLFSSLLYAGEVIKVRNKAFAFKINPGEGYYKNSEVVVIDSSGYTRGYARVKRVRNKVGLAILSRGFVAIGSNVTTRGPMPSADTIDFGQAAIQKTKGSISGNHKEFIEGSRFSIRASYRSHQQKRSEIDQVESDSYRGYSVGVGYDFHLFNSFTTTSLLEGEYVDTLLEDDIFDEGYILSASLAQHVNYNWELSNTMLLQPFVGAGVGAGQQKLTANSNGGLSGNSVTTTEINFYRPFARVGINLVIAKRFIPYIQYEFAQNKFGPYTTTTKVNGQTTTQTSSENFGDFNDQILSFGIGIAF